MALKSEALERAFIIEKTKQELEDPNPSMTPDQVMDYYSSEHPELTTATVHGPEIKDDKRVYTFKSVIGQKG